MGVRHAKQEELERLEAKTLDAQFLAIMREGLGCSPFEAEAVLGAVREVYFPFLDAAAGQSQRLLRHERYGILQPWRA